VAGKRSDLETEALTLMDDEAAVAAARPHAAEGLAKAEREAGEGLARTGAEDARLAALLGALDARRAAVVAQLEPALRTRYERARLLRGGRGVAAIDKGACGGCYRSLAPHALQEARKRERMLVCDGCGRLVMLPPEDLPGA
jgi:predicted  nucleic acid-binding Zn-ribbon protein